MAASATCGGHPGTAPAGGRACGRRPGTGTAPGRSWTVCRTTSAPARGLGRRRLPGPQAGRLGEGAGHLTTGHCPPQPRRGRLRGPAQTVDRGAHLRLAGAVSAPEQGLRAPPGLLRNLDPHCPVPVHAEAPQRGLRALSIHPLTTTAIAVRHSKRGLKTTHKNHPEHYQFLVKYPIFRRRVG